MSAAGVQDAEGAGQRQRQLAALRRTMSIAVDRLNAEKERSPCLGEGDAGRGVGGGGGVARRRVALDVLMACWGMGAWLGVNGLYVQLPLLVERLPEQWALPTSMALAVQLANLGLPLYAALRRMRPAAPDTQYIYALLGTGALALALNALLYPRTLRVAGAERSLAFLALTFLVALVGCTSSVLFYPHLRHYRDLYLSTYLVGEGLSGFLPSVLALIQGVGGEPECVRPANGTGPAVPVYPPPRFGVTPFLLALAGLMTLSVVSFSLIHKCGAFSSERVAVSAAAKQEEARGERAALLRPRWVAVLALLACLSALSNGVLPSVQSYSCLPYGSRAYHLALTLGAMANPAACLAGVWLRPVPARALAALLALAAAPLAYILATALLSPAPPLQHRPEGVVAVVVSWVVVCCAVPYARMWALGWARRGGARGMRAGGAATQLGSAAAAATMFAIVNYTHLFTQPNICSVVV